MTTGPGDILWPQRKPRTLTSLASQHRQTHVVFFRCDRNLFKRYWALLSMCFVACSKWHSWLRVQFMETSLAGHCTRTAAREVLGQVLQGTGQWPGAGKRGHVASTKWWALSPHSKSWALAFKQWKTFYRVSEVTAVHRQRQDIESHNEKLHYSFPVLPITERGSVTV